MDAKLLCPTLSVVLVKTIKALCEINIKYDNKLEITGSLHVRSDGQKVLTCLLDEETVKGQYDAARVTELAARLSMAAATFPFTHLQMSANVNHPQQMADALFSSIQGDMHILNAAQSQLPVAMGLERTMRDDNEALSNAQMAAAFHAGKQQQQLLPDTGLVVIQDMNHQHDETRTQSITASLRQQHEQEVAMIRQQHEEARQAVAALKDHEDGTRQQGTEVETIHHPSRRQLLKMLAMTKGSQNIINTTTSRYNTVASATDASGGGMINAIFTQPTMQNHIKLPDIQTLAHSLPKFPGSGKQKNVVVNSTVIAATKTEPLPSFSSPSTSSDLSSVSPTNVSMPSLDPMLNVTFDVQSEIAIDGNAAGVHRKKFQCMFCGIFLSTKCYLKNHINAMHTRARVYPCELCERYFYSAGALRIHKLRNHWHDSKKHVCTHCGETFLLPIELRKHLVKKHDHQQPQHLMRESESSTSTCVEMKMEDDRDMMMPQLQPEDISITHHHQMDAAPTSVCYQSIGDMNHPETHNSTPTPLSLEGSSGGRKRNPGVKGRNFKEAAEEKK